MGVKNKVFQKYAQQHCFPAKYAGKKYIKKCHLSGTYNTHMWWHNIFYLAKPTFDPPPFMCTNVVDMFGAILFIPRAQIDIMKVVTFNVSPYSN